MLHKLAWLALAGALGTLARYGLSGVVGRIAGADFPWGTLAVNIFGCVVAGLLLAIFDAHSDFLADHRTIVMVGFMGAFTTFSAFMADTGTLFETATTMHAGANLILHNVLGIAGFFCGLGVGRLIV